MRIKRMQRTLPLTAKTVASKNLGIAKIAKARRNGKFRRAFIVKTLYYQLFPCQFASKIAFIQKTEQHSHNYETDNYTFISRHRVCTLL